MNIQCHVMSPTRSDTSVQNSMYLDWKIGKYSWSRTAVCSSNKVKLQGECSLDRLIIMGYYRRNRSTDSVGCCTVMWQVLRNYQIKNSLLTFMCTVRIKLTGGKDCPVRISGRVLSWGRLWALNCYMHMKIICSMKHVCRVSQGDHYRKNSTVYQMVKA